jgi:hypothetical protein
MQRATKYAVSLDCLLIQVSSGLASSSATSAFFFFFLTFGGIATTPEDRLPFRSLVPGLGLLLLAQRPFFTIDHFMILLLPVSSFVGALDNRFWLLREFAISLAWSSSLARCLGIECSSI